MSSAKWRPFCLGLIVLRAFVIYKRLLVKGMGETQMYRKTSNISRTLVGNIIVDNSDAVGASPVGAAPSTSSFST